MLQYLYKIWACRYFWLSLVKIDLRGRYRRSIIGVGWSLVRPIAMTVILCLVFKRLFHRGDVWEYAPYILSGLTCWDYIVTGTKQGCGSFFQGEAYIRQQPTPVAIFPLRITLSETFHFVISMFVLLGLAWYVNGFGNLPALISLIPTMALLFCFVWALAMMAGFANAYFQDTQHLCDVVFQIIFYATPIVYYPDSLGPGSRFHWLVMNCNPLVPFIELVREPVLYSRLPTLQMYSSASLTVLIVGVVSSLLCAKLQRRLIFQL